jgi:hypothetical protein
VYAVRNGLTVGRRAMMQIDRVLARSAFGVNDVNELDDKQRWQTRNAAMQLVQTAPSLELDMRAWTAALRVEFATVAGMLAPEPAIAAHRLLRSKSGQEEHIAADVLRSKPQSIIAQTIHDVKGESSGAVLVVIDRARRNGQTSQGDLWSRPLLGVATSDDEAEELRIAFVAMTRARRLCIIALPDNTPDTTKDAFVSAGFVTSAPTDVVQ